ncbi:MAG: xylose isomerase [Acidobacteria bacterium]|nr:MAG: xylose isomerase [Acidobacteriota bacterium]
MKNQSSRREFLKASLAATCAAGVAKDAARAAFASPAAGVPAGAAVPSPLPTKKAVLLGMLPKQLSYKDRFKLARDVGFEALQIYPTSDQREAEEIKKAAEDAKIRIDSIMNEGHWEWPLSSSDPAVVDKSLNAMRTSLHNAKFWGAYSVLLVPAVVNPQTSYRDAWTRSQEQIKKLVPLAEELGVVIAVEEVWNKFLLSPLEFATYIDQFNSPWVKAWFDVGNVVLYGYPQDWIRTLGKRIVELHLKDFKRYENKYEWVNLGDGDIDWAEIRKALAEIGYSGAATTELESGDEAYLRDVSKRVDRLVLGV